MRFIFFYLSALFSIATFAQETVPVTFRHTPSNDAVRAYVPGSFNDWGPNANGFIDPNAPSRMAWVDSLGCYVKIVPLASGTTYNYKFHEHLNASGTSNRWITDPLNPRINTSDQNNSMMTPSDAFLFQLFPKSGSVVTDADAKLVFGAFTVDSDSILPDQSTIRMDEVSFPFIDYYIDSLSLVVYPLSGLSSGVHQVVITLNTRDGRTAVDSTRFTLLIDDVFFITPSHSDVTALEMTIRFRVGMGDTKVTSIRLKQIGKGDFIFPADEETNYQYQVTLQHGLNRFVVSVTDTSGTITESDTLRLVYPEPQSPEPEIHFEKVGGTIQITGSSNDPQDDPVTYAWSNQTLNPEMISGLASVSDSTFDIPLPATPGDYAIKLVATDDEGNIGSTVNFFTVQQDGSAIIPDLATVPQWVADARIYCLFVRSYTEEGTLRAAAANLEHIRDMGFSVIWLLPVMDVEGEIDQGTNIGYNIVDFYQVEPYYGSNQDFTDFVQAAHDLGLRVILDVTPNHSSRSHPIALDARANRMYSRYYDFYQHDVISHDDNGLGQSISSDGIVYYSGFSDALLNWDWQNAESRKYMLDVYAWWLREYDIDGFRFDVYWGPHRRYGSDNFDRPLRETLRKIKADILLLGETNGTGSGSETQYADQTGGIDLGYDWIFKDAIWNYPSIGALDDNLYNAGFRPGPNSFFLRFLENQDEDRVAHRYGSVEKTLPVSTALFMATGIPLLYQGQEVGMGLGMGGSKEYRLRSTVDWTNPPGEMLAPHYQKLAQIRAQFPAFRRPFEDLDGNGKINSGDPSVQVTLDTSDPAVYAFGRPFLNQNGLVVMNFSAKAKAVSVYTDKESWFEFSPLMRPGDFYYLSDLYENSSIQVLGGELDTLQVALKPYGVAIYTISLSEEKVVLPELVVRVADRDADQIPEKFALYPSYPNPFNAETVIRYDLPVEGNVQIEIYNALGRRIRSLMDKRQPAGTYSIHWDGNDLSGLPASSGIYICRIQSGRFSQSRKMVLIR